MQWGVFHRAADKYPEEWHFAPQLSDGRLPYWHSLNEFCPCGVRAEQAGAQEIWVHRDDGTGKS